MEGNFAGLSEQGHKERRKIQEEVITAIFMLTCYINC